VYLKNVHFISASADSELHTISYWYYFFLWPNSPTHC